MNTRYSSSQWHEAHDLVVLEGCTYAEAAERTGISLSAIQKKGREQDWIEERKAHAEDAGDYRQMVFELKKRHAQRALEEGDPQAIYALAKLERMFPEYRYRAGDEGIDDRAKRELVVQVVEAIVAYLETDAPSVLYEFRRYLRPLTAHVFTTLGVAE